VKICVLLKRVPDPNIPSQFVSIGPEKDDVILHPASQQSINLYDLNAVECALALKEKYGATVVVVTADEALGEQYLRRALSMGADRAVRVQAAPAHRRDAIATARMLEAAILYVGAPDIILCGRQSSDTDAGYTPYLVANALGLPAMSPIISVDRIEDGKIYVGKLGDSTVDIYEIVLPAMLLVSNEINKPRTPALKGVMAAKKMQIDVLDPGPLLQADPAQLSRPTYALKSGTKSVQTVSYSACSVEEKAAALLATIGR
jgi:electron transfer flavoprotein beta subunit